MRYEITPQEREWAQQTWEKLETKIAAQNERLGSKNALYSRGRQI